MNVAVVGGYGFVGSHLVERLLAEGHAVTAVDDMSNGNAGNLKGVARHPRFSSQKVDISSENLRSAVAGSEAVVHLAGITGEVQCQSQPAKSTAVNVGGTVNLLDACVKEGVERFVFASSAAVYGSQKSLPLEETMELNPTSVYGASKAAGEMYVRAYANAHGMRSTALRFANLYGPRRNPAYPVAIFNFAKAALSGRDIVIYGTGDQSRNFTHVSDAVQGATLALEKGTKAFGAYNIAADERTTINELAQKFADLGVARRPAIRHEAARLGDRDAYASIEKARRELGFEPKVTLDQGIVEFVDWVKGLPVGPEQ